MCGSVARTDLDAKDAALLRAMGLSPNVRVRVCRRGTPCIVEIVGREGCGCRIGLAAELARLGRPATAMALDYLLWTRGQRPQYKRAKPRHRTRTVFY